MSEVVEHLAELTGFRDRDVMDVTLVTALRDLLGPVAVGIFRLVGEPGQECWLTRARLDVHEAVARADPLWSEPGQLPAASTEPERLRCMRERAVLQYEAADRWVTLFPLASGPEVIGVLELSSRARLETVSQRMVSSILRIYYNFLGLLDYSERDTLTGLLNRKTFDESFLKAVKEMAAREQPALPPSGERRQAGPGAGYWLGVIDIDHFKSVNDRFGHLIGDEVLLLLSRLMRNSFRFHDLLYRFGGEEFVVLMRCPDEASAALAFERLRQNTRQYQFPQIGQLTISIGFTRVRPGDAPAAAFARADRAVYLAKSKGRDQVQSHAVLVAAGELEDYQRSSRLEFF